MTQFPNLAALKILVLGDVMLDRYWHGSTERVSPEAPVPVVHVQDIEHRIGGAGNVANNLAALDVCPILMGLVGADKDAQHLQNLAQSKGIQADFLEVAGSPTICKHRILSRHQQLIRLDFEKNYPESYQTLLFDKFKMYLPSADMVILSDYGKGSLKNPQLFIKAARAAGKKVIVDPKRADIAAYQGATIITPNYKEFLAMAGACANEDIMVQKAQAMLVQHNIEVLLITRGEHGMTLVTNDDVQHIGACGSEVYDVTGAGDTVVSTFAAFYCAGYSLYDAMKVAIHAAAIVVGKVGTSVVGKQELLAHILQKGLDITGVVDVPTLQTLIAQAKQRGEKIVFTNGCYDVLHHGHLRYLQRAKQFGTRLVVGVNSDASIQRSKGPSRPIHQLEERMMLLAGLKPVDWVVSFEEDTPGALIRQLEPDVLVKTNEKFNDIHDIPREEGAHDVIERGGKVYFLDRTKDCSSSHIITELET